MYVKLKNINKMTNIKDKLYNIIDFYNNINSDEIVKNETLKENKEILINNKLKLNNKLNEMTIIYNIDKNKNKIRIFGTKFVSNNKNNCYLLIDEQKSELCELFKLNEIH